MEVFPIKAEMFINDAIRAREVRVISPTGEQLGIMQRVDAQRQADELELDLVLIAPKATPPVVKIMDYGKYRFEMTKRDKEARKNQKIIEIKEVKLSPTIEEHDILVRVRNATKFLKAGKKVKVSIQFRGRQMAHTRLGYGVMDDFAKRVAEYGIVESRPRMDGRRMLMMLAPEEKKDVKDKKARR